MLQAPPSGLSQHYSTEAGGSKSSRCWEVDMHLPPAACRLPPTASQCCPGQPHM